MGKVKRTAEKSRAERGESGKRCGGHGAIRRDVSYFPPLLTFLSDFFLESPLFAWFLFSGLMLLVLFALTMLWCAVRSALLFYRKSHRQRRLSKWRGAILKYAILCIVVGTIPIVYRFIDVNLKGWI